ncbi:hypothetical protein GW933_00900 [Candidatus Falkowbacteria bacterium]|uniref:DUF5667 domain-containing protein n=1 Tax=Candidatus Buchananbacteria bacterium CG10_big_fil_rev_8_21_14_0_10_33_19 TaxID=1974525 RepID=A0A2H0W5A6_9BACT|nr:hypothetical protein [Candidatus Falkowbacteria bacterium]PIS05810.1 MAG: hypothetical protein COT80_03530 [Candidatus Buchananbacteria bacterium CG10_big_fil_rev_8_21_14_0_10_33_19]
MTNNDLIEKLNQIKDLNSGGKPDSAWIASNRDVMMSQIQPNSQNESTVKELGDGFYYGQYFNNLFRQNFLKPAIATFALVFLMLGYSATLSVANASLPGDTLYPIKTAKERVQLAFTFEEEEKVKLQMTFVSNRADELQQLVKTTSDDNNKNAVVKQTAQQIVKDVATVKDHLNEISASSMTADKNKVIEAAKEIDTKTMVIKQSLVETHSSLNENDKKELEGDLKQAIVTTEETGTSALNVIIKKYESGQSNIDDTDLAARVADRIKDAEINIDGANKVIAKVSTTTTAILNSTVSITNTSSTTPTLTTIKNQPQEAQVAIEEAKDLLDQKDFSSALDKITETNKIVSTVEENVRVIVSESIDIKNSSPTSTISTIK